MKRTLLLGLVATVIGTGTVAGVAFGSTTSHARRQTAVVRISTRVLPKLGPVLVDARGRTLYMFVPDKHAKVTCVGACAAIWPPLKLPSGAKVSTAGKAKLSLVGNDHDPAGGRVVTYAGWPLYTYVGDHAPGQATGQALNLNGGYWYVLSPSGTVIKTKLSGGRGYR